MKCVCLLALLPALALATTPLLDYNQRPEQQPVNGYQKPVTLPGRVPQRPERLEYSSQGREQGHQARPLPAVVRPNQGPARSGIEQGPVRTGNGYGSQGRLDPVPRPAGNQGPVRTAVEQGPVRTGNGYGSQGRLDPVPRPAGNQGPVRTAVEQGPVRTGNGYGSQGRLDPVSRPAGNQAAGYNRAQQNVVNPTGVNRGSLTKPYPAPAQQNPAPYNNRGGPVTLPGQVVANPSGYNRGSLTKPAAKGHV